MAVCMNRKNLLEGTFKDPVPLPEHFKAKPEVKAY